MVSTYQRTVSLHRSNQRSVSSVTPSQARSANIFTLRTQFCGSGPSGSSERAAVAQTLALASSSLRPELCAKLLPSTCGRLSAIAPVPPLERSESPAESGILRAEPAGWRPTFRLRSHSRQSQTQEIPYLYHLGYAQRRGWRGVAWPTFAAHYPLSRRSWQTSPSP
jgi:hypothetical protein